MQSGLAPEGCRAGCRAGAQSFPTRPQARRRLRAAAGTATGCAVATGRGGAWNRSPSRDLVRRHGRKNLRDLPAQVDITRAQAKLLGPRARRLAADLGDDAAGTLR